MAQTRSTIEGIELVDDPHPFKTQNDTVLENYAREHAQLASPVPSQTYIPWRK